MNRSKFYFLFFLSTATLIGGVLLFGFGIARADIPGFPFDCVANAYYPYDGFGISGPPTNSCMAPQGSCPVNQYIRCNAEGNAFTGVIINCDKPGDSCPATTPPSVSCSPKNSSLNVGDVRTFTGSGTGGTVPYSYSWSNVTCGEEWTCLSNGQISSAENQCRSSCSGSCLHTSGQNTQNCKLFFGAANTFTPTVKVTDAAAKTATDFCSVIVSSVQKKYSCNSNFQCVESASGTDLATCQNTCERPQNGSVLIKRVDASLNPISGTLANVDATVSQACTTSSGCGANPARWDGFITPGGHGAHATDLSGFTEKVGTCGPYPIGGTECQVTSFLSTPACGGGDCNFGISVTAGQVIKVVYQYSQETPPPTCTINGQTNGSMSVRVGDHFTIPWSNSSGLRTLTSSGWSGPITCWGLNVPDPNACKARYLGGGGISACPPESGKCSWGSSEFLRYLYFQTPGTSAVTITATDQAGRQGQCSFSVTATAQPPQCTLVISPPSASVQKGSAFQFNALFDPDGPGGSQSEQNVSASANWRSDNSSIASQQGGGRFRGENEGNTGVHATYSGCAGRQADASLTVTNAPNNPPVINSCDINPKNGAAPLNTNYTSSVTDPDGDAISIYRWNFGLGNTDLGPSGSFTYNSSGNYTVTMQAQDSRGAWSSQRTCGTVNVGTGPVSCPNGIKCDGTPVTGTSGQQVCGTTLTYWQCTNSGWHNTGAACSCNVVCPAGPFTGLQPSGTVSGSTVMLRWPAVTGATYYNIRVNDNTDSSHNTDFTKQFVPSVGTKCPSSPHYICQNNVSASVTSISGVPVVAGHNYSFWIDVGIPVGCTVGITGSTNFTVNPSAVCSNDGDCNDNNSCTTDHCENPGTTGAHCAHTVSGTHQQCINTTSCAPVANTASACTDTCANNLMCGGGTGTVKIRATLDGSLWSGSFIIDSFTPTGSFSDVTTSAPADFPNNAAGVHRVAYKSGGPSGAIFQNITPSGTQTLTGGGEITFTFNFVSSGNVTISGRVFNESVGTGFSGATITTCRSSPATVTTNSNGDFSFTVPREQGFCARVSPETRAGFNGPVLNNNPSLEFAKSYEWQVAGKHCASQGGCNSEQNIWDRALDTGFDFRYAPSGGGGGGGGGGCTNECSSGASQCIDATHVQTCGNFDGDSCLEWGPTPPNSCPAGQQCISNSCAAVPPNPPASFTASAGPACNIVNFFWTDTNSSPADSFTISCNSGAVTISGLTGNSYTFAGAEGNTTYNCAITALRSGLSSSARPLDTGSITTPKCPDFGLIRFGELAVILTTAGTPKNTNNVTIEVTNAGTSFTGNVQLSMISVSGAASAFTAVPHFGATTLAPGQTTTLYVTVSGAQPIGTYNGFVNVRGYAPSLDITHTIAVPLKVEVKSPGFKEI